MSYMDVMSGFGSQWTNAPAPPTYTPAYSPQALAQQNQNWLTNLYGGGANGGFGAQTDYYSGLGAAYGRNTGGFGGALGGGTSKISGAGADSGIAGWGSAPINPPTSSIAPRYQPPISFDQRYNTGGLPPMITAGSGIGGQGADQGIADWGSEPMYNPFGDNTAWTIWNNNKSAQQSPTPYASPFSPNNSRSDLARVMQATSPPPPALVPPRPPQQPPNVFQQGTRPVQGETGWVNLPQSWYNQQGTPLAKQMYDPVQAGGGLPGGGFNFPGNDPFFGGNSPSGG